ncbi:unnamed protein product, partial [Brassica napus]
PANLIAKNHKRQRFLVSYSIQSPETGGDLDLRRDQT